MVYNSRLPQASSMVLWENSADTVDLFIKSRHLLVLMQEYDIQYCIEH